MHAVLGFVEFYLAPIVIALGLVYFFWGIVNYFLIGPSYEEDRREIGRGALLWALFYIFVGLMIFLAVRWVTGVSERVADEVRVESSQQEDLLRVPNVPEKE